MNVADEVAHEVASSAGRQMDLLVYRQQMDFVIDDSVHKTFQVRFIAYR